MKKEWILLILVLFLVGCSDESSEKDNETNYTGGYSGGSSSGNDYFGNNGGSNGGSGDVGCVVGSVIKTVTEGFEYTIQGFKDYKDVNYCYASAPMTNPSGEQTGWSYLYFEDDPVDAAYVVWYDLNENFLKEFSVK